MDKYEHIAVPAEDGDYVTTGTVADYEDWYDFALELPDGSRALVDVKTYPKLTTPKREHALQVADAWALMLFGRKEADNGRRMVRP